MIKYPLVTIIIPTYNQQDYIGKSIESAIEQVYPNLEIIIADDKSNDQTGKISKGYESKYENVKYSCNSENLGRVRNYRKALYERANGDYVLNLDGDDQLIDNNFISTGIKCILEQSQDKKIMFYAACKRFCSINDKYSLVHKIPTSPIIISGKEYVQGLLNKYFFSHLTTLFNRQEALKCDFYRLNIISSDLESFARLALKGNVILSTKIVGQWNDTGKNESKVPNLLKQIQNTIWIKLVAADLKPHVSLFQYKLWKIKTKIFYSYFILNALIIKKQINQTEIKELFKSGMFGPVLLFIFTYPIQKYKRYRIQSL